MTIFTYRNTLIHKDCRYSNPASIEGEVGMSNASEATADGEATVPAEAEPVAEEEASTGGVTSRVANRLMSDETEASIFRHTLALSAIFGTAGVLIGVIAGAIFANTGGGVGAIAGMTPIGLFVDWALTMGLIGVALGTACGLSRDVPRLLSRLLGKE